MITYSNDLYIDFNDLDDDTYIADMMEYITELESIIDQNFDLQQSFNKLEQDLGKIRNYIGEKEYNRILELK